jgi:hypothetical protein
VRADGRFLKAGQHGIGAAPTSAITRTMVGQISRAGCEPADSARTSGGAKRLKKASAIWERPAL